MGWIINPFTGVPEFVDKSATPASSGFPVFYVAANEIVTIPAGRENIVTSPQTIDGVLVVDGRNTIL